MPWERYLLYCVIDFLSCWNRQHEYCVNDLLKGTSRAQEHAETLQLQLVHSAKQHEVNLYFHTSTFATLSHVPLYVTVWRSLAIKKRWLRRNSISKLWCVHVCIHVFVTADSWILQEIDSLRKQLEVVLRRDSELGAAADKEWTKRLKAAEVL